MNEKLIVASSPHIRDDDSLAKIMWAVVIALVPAGIASIYYFGLRALLVMLVCMASCMTSEYIFQRIRKQEIAVFDGSALLTGLLLAYNLPSNIPLWLCVLGSIFAIVVAKQLFGGIGFNIFNPALAGRTFLLISYPSYMSSWPAPQAGVIFSSVDTVTHATPLAVVREGLSQTLPSYFDLFIGNRGGCLGEVCIVALVLGGIFLLWRKCITWHIPVTFIGTVALAMWLFGGKQGFATGDALFNILAGGVVLGAVYMATDMVTSPLTRKGMIIFGCGCGVVTSIIRIWGGYPEGVSFSILLMNAAVPLIDRYTRPRVYGTGVILQEPLHVCERTK